MPYESVNKVFPAAADARAAFSTGAVDAWSVWDPFYASVQAAGAEVLTDGMGLMPNRSFYSSRKDFAAAHPEALDAAIAVLNEQESWEKQHLAETASAITHDIGPPNANIGEMVRPAEIRRAQAEPGCLRRSAADR